MKSVHFSVDEIVAICKAELLQSAGKNILITGIATDSRHISDGNNVLFIALKGSCHNGHQFLNEAYDKGIRTFLISEMPENFRAFQDITILKTENTGRMPWKCSRESFSLWVCSAIKLSLRQQSISGCIIQPFRVLCQNSRMTKNYNEEL